MPFEPKPDWIAEKPSAPDDAESLLYVDLPARPPNPGKQQRAWLYLHKYFGETGLPMGWGGRQLHTYIYKKLYPKTNGLPTEDTFKRLIGAKK